MMAETGTHRVTWEETFMPLRNFWTVSRYSPMARFASDKNKLLAGHSQLATGMVRRHMDGPDGPASCPLCCSAIEMLEHLLFESPELSRVSPNLGFRI